MFDNYKLKHFALSINNLEIVTLANYVNQVDHFFPWTDLSFFGIYKLRAQISGRYNVSISDTPKKWF